MIAAREQHIGRLDVAMHAPARVGGVESRADLMDDARRSERLEATLRGDQGPEVGPVDEPHHDEEHAVLVAGLENGNDVGVVDRGGEPGLAPKAFAESRVPRMLRKYELEGHHALERQFLGPVDDAHLSAADDPLDTAPREDGAEREPRGHVLAICHGFRDPTGVSLGDRLPRLRRGQPNRSPRRPSGPGGERPVSGVAGTPQTTLSRAHESQALP